MKTVRILIAVAVASLFAQIPAFAQRPAHEVCGRPAAGSTVPEPEDLRSQNGVLRVDLEFLSSVDAQGRTRYCYVYKDGAQAPNLRMNPGDELILNLKNDIALDPRAVHGGQKAMQMKMDGACANGPMAATSTNLHFHGLMIPPACHQDDVLRTVIEPSDRPYEFRFQIPKDQPPGLYWYHPHLHGFSNVQVLGGASGALIVEGIERVNAQLAGLPERVFIIRDEGLQNPNAPPAATDSGKPPVVLRDREGDILNPGTDGGKPAKDLSLNFVPVAYPDYKPAVIQMKPGERQFWRVLNASAITYVSLEIKFGSAAQPMGVVALDGAPIDDNGVGGHGVLWQRDILVPPAGRVEFIFDGPALGVHASMVTRRVDTGPAGENDPTRTLATIVSTPHAARPHSSLPTNPVPAVLPRPITLREISPAHVRKLYFSERPQDPNDPKSPTAFFITVEGQQPAQFDPNSPIPNITVHQGDVEDWIIENRAQELHNFHIHQLHFMVMESYGVPVNEPFLRDTVNVPYWDGKSPTYPSVKLRMDFRNPNSVGTFVYHCHLLEHEDGGMMGIIRVLPTTSGH